MATIMLRNLPEFETDGNGSGLHLKGKLSQRNPTVAIGWNRLLGPPARGRENRVIRLTLSD